MNFPSSKKLTAAVLLAALTATSIAPGVALAADSSDNVATVQPGGDQPPEKPPGDQQPTPPDGGKPGEQPPAKPGGADTMEYDYAGELSGAVTADGEEVTRDGETISTETVDQNVGLAQNGGSLTLTDATLDKSGSDTNGDNCNFYGINSILLSVNDDSVIKVADSKLTADSTGSNAIFATDGGTVYANNNTIVTSASNSRGLDATYGGTVIGNLLAISTAGDHSAALATDRGGGNISLTNSSLFTAGSGSPLLYSTGNVQVDNVKGTATGSQIAGMEGLNTILIKNSQLTSEVTGKTASDPVANGVIIYQSTSGDAEAATGETAEFEAENSTLASDIQEGSMFYLTNTTANVVLKNTTLDFDSDAANLLTIGGNDANNWGTPGKNGADVTFTGLDQELAGNIDVDTISSLDLYLLDGTTYTGATTISENAAASEQSDAPISVSIDGDASWIVIADSSVTNLHIADGGKLVDQDGKCVSVKDASGNILASGESDVTVTVTGSYDTTVTTSDDNSLNATVIDRDDFDVAYTTNTEFGTNAGKDRNDDITIQEPTGGDDVMGGDQPGGDKPPAEPGDETSLPFTDVASDHWAYQDIADIYSAGLMTGTSADTFSPELSVNRAMLVSILYRLEDASTKPADAGFTDVVVGAWYADAVNWAKENNIVSGYSDTLFGPEDTLTREQFAAILYRYAAYKGYDITTSDNATLDNFTDASSLSSGFDNVLLWANDKGYIGGMTETTLAPQGSTTRAQASAILLRFLRTENALPDTSQQPDGNLDDNGEPAKPEGDLQPEKPEGEA